MIQQLRMDEYVGNIQTLDAPPLEHAPIVLSDEESQDPFCALLMFYATRALQFPLPVLTDASQPPECELY